MPLIKRIFDTDHHITPPPDLWTSRMPQKFQDRAPRLVDLEDGTQAWSFEGGEVLHLFGLENVGAKDPRELRWRVNYSELQADYYDPKARLLAMDIDGIDAALLFPSVAGHIAVVRDDELYLACVQTYNDGVWEWVHEGDPNRIFPAAMIPSRNLDEAMAELARVAELGFRHFSFTMSPSGGNYPSPEDDPFWALVQETGMAISMHGGGSGRVQRPAPPVGQAVKPEPPVRDQEMIAAGRASGLGAQMALGCVIMTGVLERFPDLKIGLVETSAGWLPSFVEQLDALYLQHRWLGNNTLRRLPSEYARQVKISVDRELQGIKYRDHIGVDNLMFGTDYPHIGSFWPHTRQYLDLLLDDVPEEDVDKILWSNAASLYGVQEPARV
ncbi:MAG TPA: amidohydrolase family protein [Acidimicrobiales bacterium]|nr:amidohydrolase family protein [Acidimicrobiales bacterium]